jgi:electron-transferring-flavoprotein dehydrogenase
MTREAMEYDVVIVGAGPSGLSAAIRLKQLAEKAGTELSVCVVEKGSEVGAHILSGAVIEPRALEELSRLEGTRRPAEHPVKRTASCSSPPKRPTSCPRRRRCTTTATTSSAWATWCAGWASRPRRWASRSTRLRRRRGALPRGRFGKGIATGDMGVEKNGEPAPTTSRASSCTPARRSSPKAAAAPSPRAVQQVQSARGVDPQTYGIGIKELWEVRPEVHQQGLTMHTVGWPVSSDVYGGSFLYHLENNQVAVGFVVGLDYSNPHLSPYEEFQRFKTHPEIRKFFEGGRHRLRRAGAQRRWLPVGAQAQLPGRRADRRHRGLPQRAQGQGTHMP